MALLSIPFNVWTYLCIQLLPHAFHLSPAHDPDDHIQDQAENLRMPSLRGTTTSGTAFMPTLASAAASGAASPRVSYVSPLTHP